MGPIVTPPDVIPDEVQADHLEEARSLVRQRATRPARTETAAPSGSRSTVGSVRRVRARLRALTPQQRRNVAAAGLVALPGSLFLTGLWAWLAATTGEIVWWFATAVGTTVAAVLVTAIAVLGLARTLRAGSPAAPTSAGPEPAPRMHDTSGLAA